MRKPENLIEHFYKSFAKKDYMSMQACYHKEAVFSDPVFTNLSGNPILAMWHMLCIAGKDMQITYNNVGAFDNSAQANWKAVYTFSKTGRIVHNNISARFYFKDDLIIHHADTFDFWKWSSMALGLSGYLLGWTQFLQQKVQRTAMQQLEHFIKQNPQYL
jgi:hypothetical protein